MKGFFVCVLLALALITPQQAQSEGITKDQADAILSELKQIRLLLEKQQQSLQGRPARQPTPDQKVKLKLEDIYVLGDKTAPVTLVEFTDYQCPYCSQFHKTTFPQIKKNFIDTGKVRFFSRDLPLSFHQQAVFAARAARCAGEQDKFWEMRHVLSVNPRNLSQQDIVSYANELQLDMALFEACVDSDRFQAEINNDKSTASSIGINGTPGFVLGFTPHDETLEGVRLTGAHPYSVFEAKINTLLAEGNQNAGLEPEKASE